MSFGLVGRAVEPAEGGTEGASFRGATAESQTAPHLRLNRTGKRRFGGVSSLYATFADAGNSSE